MSVGLEPPKAADFRALSPQDRVLGTSARLARTRVLIGMIGFVLTVFGMVAPVWAAQGSWVGQLPRQTIVISPHVLESQPISLPPSMDGAKIQRVRWVLRRDTPTPSLKIWLCQEEVCLPLVSARGTTERFAGRPASMPFRLRFQGAPNRHAGAKQVVTGGQLIVDYRQ